MINYKKSLALVLVAFLLLMNIPVITFSDEKAIETIVYNLGTREVRVGFDIDKALATPWTYKLFDEKGNYEIELEDNAFFPYEIQFKYGDTQVTKWFDAPESTIEIEGHVFTVKSNQNNDSMLSQIGVWVDGKYIAARPEPKTFTNIGDAEILLNDQIQPSNFTYEPLSLKPLTEVNVTLDLTTLDLYQFRDIKFSTILSGMEPSQVINGGAKVAWARVWNDNYQIVEQADKINLINFLSDFSNLIYFDFIVGSALQLDESNVRYRVEIQTAVPKLIENAGLTIEQSSVRSEAILESKTVKESRWSDRGNINVSMILPRNSKDDTYYVGLNLNTRYSAYTVKAFKGDFSTTQEIASAVALSPEINVSEKLINPNLSQPGKGYQLTSQIPFVAGGFFTLVIYEGSEVVDIISLLLNVRTGKNEISFDGLYDNEGKVVGRVNSFSDKDNYQKIEIMMNSKEVPSNDLYRLILVYGRNSQRSFENNATITRAVIGDYDSINEIQAQPDIKAQLFPDSKAGGKGYLSDYSGENGVTFSILADNDIYRFNLKTVNNPNSIKPPLPEEKKWIPNPGMPDSFFAIHGATYDDNGIESHLSNVFILPAQHDTYYEMGYQTLIYGDSVNTSELKPFFWKLDNVQVYSGENLGTIQESGVSKIEVTSGAAIKYAVANTEGKILKNYRVSFIKKHLGGPKIFVNGLNGESSNVREVFFNTAFKNQHDIFIANIGDQPLVGLNVKLENGKNVKLDPYWTVGGDKNDTLAPMPTGYLGNYKQANIAKIRLLPDGNSEGNVEGKLTITADGQEPVVISLTGSAGNPRLTTESIPESVKYTPFSSKILLNNNYWWNTATMNLVFGKLPMGVELKENGELYGVPKESGTFRFGIGIQNSDFRFRNSMQEYTIFVKENTNENVHNKNESFLTKIPDMKITDIKDRDIVMVSALNLDHESKIFLNGLELVKGKDYDIKEGNASVTIRSLTFHNAGIGTHTIAVEFRDKEGEMKIGAQNFTISSVSTGGSGPSIGTGGATPTDTKNPPNNPQKESTFSSQELVKSSTALIKRLDIRANEDGSVVLSKQFQEFFNVALEEMKSNKSQADLNIPALIEFNVLGIAEGAQALNLQLSASEVKLLSDISNSSLKVNVESLGSITLPNSALKSISSIGSGTIGLNIQKSGSIYVGITLDKNPMEKIDGGIRVELKGPYNGNVVLFSTNDGTEKILKKSVLKNDKILAILDGSGHIKVIENSKSFEDIKPTDWFYNSIMFSNTRRLINGTTKNQMKPLSPMTRGMATSILHSLENHEESVSKMSFNDVEEKKWYSKSIIWASSKGIANGDGDGYFKPNENITREQLLVMLLNYAKYLGLDTSSEGDVQNFSDNDKISSWSSDAMKWAVGMKLINGDGKNLRPQQIITRAETATILMNFIDIIVKIRN